jgi:hypothetical protein
MKLSSKFNAKSAARWEKTRAAGKLRFVLRWVLCWGIVMAGLMTGVHAFLSPGSSVVENLIINLVMFPALGILYGIFMWNGMDAAYRYYLSQQELESLDALSAKS